MPAGDLLAAPGQIEWDGLLIDLTPGAASGLWLYRRSDVTQGWQVRTTSEDQETEVGAAPGRRITVPMYPTIIGLCAETAEDVTALMDSMEGETAAPLAWYDRPTNRKLIADAVPRRCEPSTALEVQFLPHRLVDVQWIIPRPGDIEVL